MTAFEIFDVGDSALTVDFGNTIDIERHSRIIAMAYWFQTHPFPGLLDVVIGYQSITLCFDSFRLRPGNDRQSFFEETINRAFSESDPKEAKTQNVRIPVCYESPYALDIAEVAHLAGMAIENIINVHQQVSYRVFMNGFIPGFAYMGTVDARLKMPRKVTPRPMVPAGSVGIAGLQTGIYPVDSPGGWQIIGRTPRKLFAPNRNPPVFLSPGDTVEFYAITREQYITEEKAWASKS